MKAFPPSFHGLRLQMIVQGSEQQSPTTGCGAEAVTTPWAERVTGFSGTEWCLGQGEGFSPVDSRPTTGISGSHGCSGKVRSRRTSTPYNFFPGATVMLQGSDLLDQRSKPI